MSERSVDNVRHVLIIPLIITCYIEDNVTAV